MIYPKQATTLFFLMLFALQAFKCRCHKNASTPVSHKVLNKKHLASAGQKDEDAGYQTNKNSEFAPEFDPKFYSDPKPKSGDASDSKSGYESDSKSGDASDSKSGYESGYESDSTPVPTRKPSFSSDLAKKNSLEKFDFERNIEEMRREADKTRNITWHLSGNELTRVVDNNRHSSSPYVPADYIVIGLNIYRAASKICTLYGQDGSELAKKAHEFVDFYHSFVDFYDRSLAGSKPEEDYWIKKIKEINKAVVDYLKSHVMKNEDPESINKKLRLAENYVGLEDTHYNVTTIFKVENQKFELRDEMWFPLTEKQKQAYQYRKSRGWYKRLGPFEQMFIDAYVDKLVDGKHYIPTQLRSIPGLRNLYQTTISAYDKNNKSTQLARYYHSGSLASPIEWTKTEDQEADREITKDNWKQIQEKDKNVEAISLNYNMNVPPFKQLRERKIVQDTKQVVGDDKFRNISINGIGTSYNIKKGYDELIEDVVTFYKSKYPKSCDLFKNDLTMKGTKKKEIIEQEIDDPKDKGIFKKLVKLEEYATKPETINNLKQDTYVRDNPNATFIASYIACKAILAIYGATSSVLFSCKSGKDRTGRISYEAIKNIIKIWYPQLDTVQLGMILALCGHHPLLADVNAGMTGRRGLKDTRHNRVFRGGVAATLCPKTATFTEIKY